MIPDTFQPNDQVRCRISGRTGIVLEPQPFQRRGTYRVRFYDIDGVFHAPERNLSETQRYHVEYLQNGLTRVFDRSSGLSGLFNPDGSYRSGDLRDIPVSE